jgi:hypothetical protein
VIYLKSLWNLLSLRRVLLLTQHGQDAIDQLNEKFKEPNNDYLDLAKLPDYILSGKKNVNLINHFNILNILYKLIVYKIIPEDSIISDTESFENMDTEIKDLIEELDAETNDENSEEKIDLTSYNLKGLKIKNIWNLWKVLVSIYFENSKK